jgi:hypothetical protein
MHRRDAAGAKQFFFSPWRLGGWVQVITLTTQTSQDLPPPQVWPAPHLAGLPEPAKRPGPLDIVPQLFMV